MAIAIEAIFAEHGMKIQHSNYSDLSIAIRIYTVKSYV